MQTIHGEGKNSQSPELCEILYEDLRADLLTLCADQGGALRAWMLLQVSLTTLAKLAFASRSPRAVRGYWEFERMVNEAVQDSNRLAYWNSKVFGIPSDKKNAEVTNAHA